MGLYNKEVEIQAEVDIDGKLVTKSIIQDTSGNNVTTTSNSLDVMLSDSTTEPIDTYFLEQLSSFTLSADTVASTLTVLVYTFEATVGHGIAPLDEIILLDIVGNKEFYATVISVATDTITVDRPIDNLFPSATSLARIVNSNMAVDGSGTPRIFTVRAGSKPIDITRIIIAMTDQTSMDDAKFGGLSALAKGFVFRAIDGFNKVVFNFKTNGEIAGYCYDVRYSDKAPSGFFGLTARITFAGQSKHGVALRVSTFTDALQWIVQDDLTDLDTLRVAAQGHQTEGENP
jgi:hypothetical protein